MKRKILSLIVIMVASTNLSFVHALSYKKERKCLTDIILYESTGEPYEGMVAAGYVAVTRAKSNKFPSTICKVSHAPGAFAFHYHKSKMKKTKKDRIRASKIAGLILAKKVKNPTPGAVYFRTKKYHKIGKPIRKIGRHYFAAYK